jgi:hypothetical protein
VRTTETLAHEPEASTQALWQKASEQTFHAKPGVRRSCIAIPLLPQAASSGGRRTAGAGAGAGRGCGATCA